MTILQSMAKNIKSVCNLIMILIFLTGFTYCKTDKKRNGKPPGDEQLQSALAKWSKEKAWDWYNDHEWLVGTNFNPSTSINQLEFWQEETFDPETIELELGWSADLGMNAHRVYLHNLLWDQDSMGFLNRIDKFLSIADKYNIKTMFVLLDDCWHPVPKLGKQPDPLPRVHNSGWVQAPGSEILGDSTRHDELEGYIKGVIRYFAKDSRVLCWDLYNEPGNGANQEGRVEYEVKDKAVFSLALLRKAFTWAREVNPDQPITTGIWKGRIENWGTPDSLPPLDRFMIEQSDVISYHCYDGDIDRIKRKITELEKYNRPILCTEYLNRPNNSFQILLPIFKDSGIAAINWGFVSGKTNTIYPWSSWDRKFTAEPEIWHHDVMRKDGTPFSDEEAELLRELTGRQ